MKKFIRVADHVTAATFGSGQDYFDSYIKNKVLDVQSELRHTMFVKDENDECWTVFKEDVVQVDAAGHPLKLNAHA